MPQQPTLVLVHGAWHGPWCWTTLLPHLDGTPVRTVTLPSSGPDPDALGDLTADAAAVRDATDAVDGPVVVCAHSYGGIPVSQALAGAENVRHLVYLAAFQLDTGESLLSAVGGTPPDWWRMHDGHVDAARPHEIFYQDCAAEDADDAAARLNHQSRPSFTQPLTAAAWHTSPSTYILCAKDAAIPLFAQEAMSARSRGTHRLDSGHSPFLSQPAALATLLRDVLTGAS